MPGPGGVHDLVACRGAVVRLDDATEAVRHFESGAAGGKAVVRIDSRDGPR